MGRLVLRISEDWPTSAKGGGFQPGLRWEAIPSYSLSKLETSPCEGFADPKKLQADDSLLTPFRLACCIFDLALKSVANSRLQSAPARTACCAMLDGPV